MQTPGGFIAGRYEIIFKRPHWDNTHKFIEVMELLTQEYRLRPEEEGVFGRTFEGYVKHVYQVRDKKGNIENENRDFAIAKSQFSPNPMLKKGLTHYKE